MGYKIRYTYDTGDTFSTQEGVIGEFDYVWESKEEARAALKRMGEHYNWIESINSSYKDDLPKPEWFKNYPKDNYGLSWYFNVIHNNEEVWLYSASYCGYFETLVEAEIISEQLIDEDKIRFRSW